MSDRHGDDRVEDVLDAFVASAAGPGGADLGTWIRRFPRYEQQLRRCATSRRLVQALDTGPDAHGVTADALMSRGKEIVGTLLGAGPAVASTGTAPARQTLPAEAAGVQPRGVGMRHRILLVDDDRELVELLAFALARNSLEPLTAYDAPNALRLFRERRPDLVLLDINLGSGGTGLDVLRALRQAGRTPVIMLTALDAEDDKVRGLELGADDYMTKPFSHKELIARIRAQLRRAGFAVSAAPGRPPASRLEVGPLVLDLATHSVTKNGQPLGLTLTEFRLLYALMLRADTVVSTADLLKEVWGYPDPGGTDVVRVTVHRLRRKLEDDPAQPTLLHTIPGVGVLLKREP
jgi:two-component system, OmpR family, response regulator VicR